ncbi:type VII secretion target [Mycolicibacterium chubuense]|uniref:type VII secretion target n=1 Tax=Mycolicibacterium chubuense TaxID=1800 RepID=UPI001EF09E71|nr:type VII secretion target [Mycolicibacterium chubuense]
MSVDTDLVRAYGAASSGHADGLRAAAARLTEVGGAAAPMFGPVGARFLAALTRAAEGEAHTVTGLGGALTAGRDAAAASATSYDVADTGAGHRVTGSW